MDATTIGVTLLLLTGSSWFMDNPMDIRGTSGAEDRLGTAMEVPGTAGGIPISVGLASPKSPGMEISNY